VFADLMRGDDAKGDLVLARARSIMREDPDPRA
jgi:hypothetical protein